jgi:hypothetical protein
VLFEPQIASLDRNRTGLRFEQAAQERDERSLAGAVWPEQRSEAARFDCKVYAVERLALAVGKGQVADFEGRGLRRLLQT